MSEETPNLAAVRRAAAIGEKRLREFVNQPAPKPVKPCELHSVGGALVSDACPIAYPKPTAA